MQNAVMSNMDKDWQVRTFWVDIALRSFSVAVDDVVLSSASTVVPSS